MQPITNDLQTALNSQNPRYIKKVLLYPRGWDAQRQEYIFAAPLDITRYILEMSPVKSKLDNEAYSQWNTANASITLSAEFSLPQGAALHGAKAEFFSGCALETGQKELIKIFRAFALEEPTEREMGRTITLNLSGELARLALCPAQDISMLAQYELLGQDEGNNFTTANPAVGAVIEVRRGPLSEGPQSAAVLKEEDAYQISSLNQHRQGAALKLTHPLQNGEGLWITYRHWHTDESLDWIALQIAQTAKSESWDIDEISFEETVEHRFAQPSLQSFAEGAFEYAVLENGLIKPAQGFMQTVDYTWAVAEKPAGVSFNFTPNSIALDGNNFATVASGWGSGNDSAYGTWEFQCAVPWGEDERQFKYFISSTNNRTTTNGYCISEVRIGTIWTSILYRVDNGVRVAIHQTVLNLNVVGQYRYRISRGPGGEFRIQIRYINGPGWHNFGHVCTDNTHKTSAYFGVVFYFSAANMVFDISHSPLAATGHGDYPPVCVYTSPVIDGTTALEAWGNFSIREQSGAGCSSLTYVRVKEDISSPWGQWAAISDGNTIADTPQFAQFKWVGCSDLQQLTAPALESWGISWQARNINIAVVNMAAMTCLDVLQELAKMSGFKIGYDYDGKFLFKKRVQSAPCVTLTKHEIIEIETLSPGASKMYNRVAVNFGPYSRVIDCKILGDARPDLIDSYGVRTLDISSAALLPAQNANLARALAPGIYQQACRLKKRAAAVVKFLPYLELGDVVNISYGQFLNAQMQIEGIELNLETWQMRLDLAEV